MGVGSENDVAIQAQSHTHNSIHNVAFIVDKQQMRTGVGKRKEKQDQEKKAEEREKEYSFSFSFKHVLVAQKNNDQQSERGNGKKEEKKVIWSDVREYDERHTESEGGRQEKRKTANRR